MKNNIKAIKALSQVPGRKERVRLLTMKMNEVKSFMTKVKGDSM